jgi:Zinc carboxypeptidase
MNLRGKISVLAALAATAIVAAAPGTAAAAPDPAGCTQNIQYDPSIPTFKQYADANGIANNTLGGITTGTTAKHSTLELYGYFDAVIAATAGNPRVSVVKRDLGTSYLGKPMRYYVVGTPENIANLDAGRNDGAFWRGVREGTISAAEGAAQAQDRPAFFWNTATPHGSEPAAGEAISRVLYELTARTDCANLQRLDRLDNFLMPVTNPDGRDASAGGTRTTGYGFDPNRDFASRNQDVNATRVTDGIIPYPGPVYIDAHQQSSGYFFPPNEDPVLHEMSDFTIQTIQDRIGPALQEKFNDQSAQYRNYNAYDLFAIVYGDSVPSLQLGAAGMTFEKGTSENYGKQVYDHYLAMDETMNVISDDKDDIMAEWAAQWGEAKEQGENGELEENELVSPLNPAILQEPNTDVFGYYYLPNNHSGDTAKLIREMRETNVHVYRLDEAVTAPAAHNFADGYSGQTGPLAGTPITGPVSLPAGTLFIPMDQTQKHWIQGILGADPFFPSPFFYDVASWSFSHMRGMSGNGYLTEALPEDIDMTEVSEANYDGVTDGTKPVLAFPTDSAQGIAMMIELLAKNATVSRAEEAFTAGGKSFPTGTALVDTASTTGVDLAALSDKRQTPITGLDSYPVARKALVKPKIGLYTGGAATPTNPLGFGGAAVGHCGTTNQTAFCELLHSLAVNLGLPYQGAEQVLYPVTSADLTPTNNLIAGNFTALIVPGGAAALTAGNAAAVQAFVNAGGRYVSDSANGTATARNAGFTNLNTSATNVAPFNDPCPPPQGASLQTPGSVMTADFDTDNPVSWGFDNGGVVFRQASNSPVYNPATLPGTPPNIPDTNVAISYADPLTSYAYSCNALGPGELPGRPYATDSAFGSGHSTVLGSNPWFRSWVDVEWRMALNGALYPTGPSVPAAPSRMAGAAEPEAEPLAKSELPKVKVRPLHYVQSPREDARIVSYEGSKADLKQALRNGDVPRSKRQKAAYVQEGDDLVLVFRRAWEPGAVIKPWLFRLGAATRDLGDLDTNIPARSH